MISGIAILRRWKPDRSRDDYGVPEIQNANIIAHYDTHPKHEVLNAFQYFNENGLNKLAPAIDTPFHICIPLVNSIINEDNIDICMDRLRTLYVFYYDVFENLFLHGCGSILRGIVNTMEKEHRYISQRSRKLAFNTAFEWDCIESLTSIKKEM